VEEFRRKALGAFTRIRIYSFVGEVTAVELLVGKLNSLKSINEHMIKEGYARKC